MAVLEKFRRKPVDIPVLGPGAPVTGEHLALINSSWRAPKHDSQFPGNKVYRFDVILAGDPSVLARVERVVYMLPPAWGKISPLEVNSKTRPDSADLYLSVRTRRIGSLFARHTVYFANSASHRRS